MTSYEAPAEPRARIAQAADRLETTLVRALSLVPVALPEGLTEREGRWRGSPSTLVTRAYASPRLRFVRFVRIEGASLSIANLLALPSDEAAEQLPVLGADLVWLGAGDAMIAADASPLSATSARRLAALPEVPAAGDIAGLGGHRAPPPFCARWFSPRALCTRVAAADGRAWDRTLEALEGLARLFVSLVQQPEPSVSARSSSTAASNLEAYLRDHREDDRGLRLLHRAFGADFASRYILSVLFPAREVAPHAQR